MTQDVVMKNTRHTFHNDLQTCNDNDPTDSWAKSSHKMADIYSPLKEYGHITVL